MSTPPWQERARTKEWPEEEILRIEKLMRVGRSIDRVIRVTSWEIVVSSVEDGRTNVWKWRRYECPEPAFVQQTTAIPWCPAHGDGCSPDDDGCGLERIVFYVPCDCPPRGHFYDCEVLIWKEEARKKAMEPQPEVPVAPRRRKEEYVPKAVQLRLDLEK